MEFKADKTHCFDQFLSIDKRMTILFLLFSFPAFKYLRINPEIDIASIYELSVILAPITFVMHGFSL